MSSPPPYPPPYGQQPYWQQPPPPPPPPSHPHREPQSYPLVLRTWDYEWWKPLVGILLMLLVGLIVAPLVLMPVAFVGVVLQGGSGPLLDRFMDALDPTKGVTPASMLYLNLTLASLTIVAMLVVRLIHRMRARWLSSVQPGIRWKFLAGCFGLSVVALAASLLVSGLLPGDTSGTEGAHPGLPTGQLAVTAVVILLTTPLQALGEEYAFRGYLMQAVGSLTRSRVVAVVVTAGLFALAHGVQNFPLFFDRFAFGLMAGLVVVLVGGLEAGIALHVMNNLLAFGVAVVYDQLDSTLNVAEATWWQIPVTVTQNGVYLVLVLVLARSMGLRNRTAPPAPEPAPAQAAPDW